MQLIIIRWLRFYCVVRCHVFMSFWFFCDRHCSFWDAESQVSSQKSNWLATRAGWVVTLLMMIVIDCATRPDLHQLFDLSPWCEKPIRSDIPFILNINPEFQVLTHAFWLFLSNTYTVMLNVKVLQLYAACRYYWSVISMTSHPVWRPPIEMPLFMNIVPNRAWHSENKCKFFLTL